MSSRLKWNHRILYAVSFTTASAAVSMHDRAAHRYLHSHGCRRGTAFVFINLTSVARTRTQPKYLCVSKIKRDPDKRVKLFLPALISCDYNFDEFWKSLYKQWNLLYDLICCIFFRSVCSSAFSCFVYTSLLDFLNFCHFSFVFAFINL